MPNKVYVARETPIVWSDTSGALVMTLNNLGADVARIGARKDFGSGSTSQWYEWRLTVRFETPPVPGELIRVYLSTSNGSRPDGEEGIIDAAVADNESLGNMKLIGSLRIGTNDADHDMTASGICRIPTRYVSPVIYNGTVDSLKATNDTSKFTLTPIPSELQ